MASNNTLSMPSSSLSNPEDGEPHPLLATPPTRRQDARYAPYTPILATGSDRRSRKRKSISWQSEDKLRQFHHFELIPDERINVTRNSIDQQNDTNASISAVGGSNLNANNKVHNAPGVKISNASVDPVRRLSSKNESECVNYMTWRPLILIDFTPELPPAGWNSKERSTQAERESCVLGAIDLPGQPSTLDEPEQQLKLGSSNGASPSGSSSSSTPSISAVDVLKDEPSSPKIIPSESTDGIYVEYPDMYTTDIINGIRLQNNSDSHQVVVQNIAAFCNPQSQIVPNQLQQQMVHATHNPYNFQDMVAQFQPAQIPIQFPFQTQQQPVQRFQTAMVPFSNQPQTQIAMQPTQQQPIQPSPFADQQPGPIMPWLNYPLNQSNENSHSHLFRRPAT